MNKRQIVSFVLAAGLVAGAGFGLRAMADDTNTQPSTQPSTQTEQTPSSRFGRGFFGMMKGFGRMGGGCFGGGFGFNSDLTAEQQKELNLLRAEAQNIKVDYQAQLNTLHEALRTAIDAGSKTDVLAAWDSITGVHEEIQTKLAPTQEKIKAILGTEADDWNLFEGRWEDSWMAEQMEDLKNAQTDEAAKVILDQLKTGQGRGGMMYNKPQGNGRGRMPGLGGRMNNRGRGFQNGTVNPGSNNGNTNSNGNSNSNGN
ncbi:hypothetical protein NQU17_13480 [Clostridiaceae bacterium HFYG-1003]|nr:hypothetical protein NQU17_13480 [Clostridiaceae bacterium HFYG-1003]